MHVDTYVILEKMIEKKPVGIKHPHKGFLPDGYTKETPLMNPISFVLNPNNFENQGNYEYFDKKTTF